MRRFDAEAVGRNDSAGLAFALGAGERLAAGPSCTRASTARSTSPSSLRRTLVLRLMSGNPMSPS